MRRRTFAGVVAIIVVAVTAYSRAQQQPQGPAAPQVFDTFHPPPCSPIGRPTGGCAPGQRHPIRVVQVAAGFARPRTMAFLPDNRGMLVTENGGPLLLVRDGAAPQPVAGWPASALRVEQSHSIVVHPRFAQNQTVYLSYVKGRDDGMTAAALARARFDGSALTDVRDVFVADGWVRGGPVTTRAEFGPDGMIYLATGDHDPFINSANNSVRMLAQDLNSHIGKILRLREDGTAAPDNPFVGRQGAKPEIYTRSGMVGMSRWRGPSARPQEVWWATRSWSAATSPESPSCAICPGSST